MNSKLRLKLVTVVRRARHGQQAQILLRQPGGSGMDGRTLAPLRRSVRPSTCMSTAVAPAALGPKIMVHFGIRLIPPQAKASRGPSHGQHCAECRVTLRAGRRQTTWHARGLPFCLHASTARAGRRDNQSPPTVPHGCSRSLDGQETRIHRDPSDP